MPVCFHSAFWILVLLFSGCGHHTADNSLPGVAAEPKTVYIRVWNETEQGVAPPGSLTFSCYLERDGRRSEIRTSRSVGCGYFSTADGRVHHLSIQCGNFNRMNWDSGDRMMVRVLTNAIPNREHSYRVMLDAEGEQYGPDMILQERP